MPSESDVLFHSVIGFQRRKGTFRLSVFFYVYTAVLCKCAYTRATFRDAKNRTRVHGFYKPARTGSYEWGGISCGLYLYELRIAIE
jgi:hypothetical protein